MSSERGPRDVRASTAGYRWWPLSALAALWQRRYGEVRFRVIDIVTLSYMAGLGALLPVFGDNIPDWKFHFFVHLGFLAVALEAIRASERNPRDRLLAIPRMLYPAFLITYGFLEIAKVQTLFSGTPWATEYLVQADLAIFGVHPTVWVQDFYHPLLTELMAVFRVLYYVIPFIVLVPLMWRDKRDHVMAAGAVVMLTYVVNYSLFILAPGVNPRQIPEIAALHSKEFSGFLFAAIEHAIQGDQGTVAGASFPSAHVSATMAWTLVAFRYIQQRWVGYFLAVCTVGTALATVYLGFHHAVDPIGGFILAFACYPVAMWLLQRRGEDPVLPAGASADAPAESLTAKAGSP